MRIKLFLLRWLGVSFAQIADGLIRLLTFGIWNTSLTVLVARQYAKKKYLRERGSKEND